MMAQVDYKARIHAVLGPLIMPGAPIALLDFPSHANVGDSAIWLGELEYLGTYHKKSPLVWVSDHRLSAWPKLPELPPQTVILICGGGNFGDLWPVHQRHRERILAEYPRHRVIQLPQSIHFDDRANASKCSDALNRHPDFHLVVRDHPSFELAQALHRGPTHLCPDMALFLGDLERPIKPIYDITALLRTDKEKAPEFHVGSIPSDINVTDWMREPVTLYQRLEKLFDPYPVRTRALRPAIYRGLARERTRRGCGILASGRVVITDRLHAHILCTLMSIPHVILDNSYRKIGNFRDAWQTGSGICKTASNLDEAVSIARALCASHTAT